MEILVGKKKLRAQVDQKKKEEENNDDKSAEPKAKEEVDATKEKFEDKQE